MAFKGWFKGKGRGAEPSEAGPTLEDLIVLERYPEAEERLRAKLKVNPDDLHSHLKLAEVYTALRRVDRAVDEYVYVAEAYALDGFFDKGIALLARVQKMLPADDTLRQRIQSFEEVKGLEHKRAAAMSGLRQGRSGATESGARVIEFQRRWDRFAGCAVIQRLGADQITRLFSGFEVVELGAGTVLAREGETGAELYVVAGGVVEAVVDDGADGRSTLRTFGTRDILGERALLERQPWPATLRVTENALLLRLDREGLERALVGSPDPRGLLDLLREQGGDRELAAMATRLRGS